jgi:molybdopterin-guanine dinucleotide biosynthesis protein A
VLDAFVAILAGGRSTRMGRPKPAVPLAGRPLIDYPIEAARSVGLEPWVIAKPDTDLPPLDCRIVHEPAEPVHPLCGIVAALDAAAPWPIVALGADMPFVEDKLIAWIASHLTTAVVEVDGRQQPLLARYGGEDLDPLREALAREEAAQVGVSALDAQVIGEDELRRFGDPRILSFNVNTPADLAEAERILADRAAAASG